MYLITIYLFFTWNRMLNSSATIKERQDGSQRWYKGALTEVLPSLL
jgi:hypothetical protein